MAEVPFDLLWFGLFLIAAVLILLAFVLYVRKNLPFSELPPLDFYFKVSSQFVEVDGFQIHYLQSGKGPHLLLIHGIGASTFCWREIFLDLSKHFTVTAIDLPGFGKSTKKADQEYGLDQQTERVLKFLDKLEIRQTRLVGSSMGGALALWLGRLYPQKFFEVAAIAPACHPKLVPLRLKTLEWTSPLWQRSLNYWTMRSILQRVVQNPKLITKEIIHHYLTPFSGDPASIRTFIRATELISDPRLELELPLSKERILILWGGRDRMVRRKHIDEVRAWLPSAEYREHPDGSHHLMEDQPQWVTHWLIEFFGSHD